MGGTVVTAGTALCLSGGGYRAMLFHLGALRRLNEVGRLPVLDCVSSVSGGSISAAALARRWSQLDVDGNGVAASFALVAGDLMRFSRRRLDLSVWARGLVSPGSSPARELARAYDRHLLGPMTLRDLPHAPRFVVCATNLSSGSLVRFERDHVADAQVGMWPRPDLPLATAVAASSAFPPALSPLRIALPLSGHFAGDMPPLHCEPYVSTSTLADGGVYDNLGLQPALHYTTLLVSDAGGPFRPRPRPPGDWVRQSLWAWKVTDHEVRLRRRAELVGDLVSGARSGAYWHTTADLTEGAPGVALAVDPSWTIRLSTVHTRLWPVGPDVAPRLVNLGYTACDAALRAHLDAGLPPPPGWPHPEAALDARSAEPVRSAP